MRPISPQPGYSEADVENAMMSGQFVFADCYTIEPKQGDPMRYTTAQQPVSVVPVGEVMRQTYGANDVLIQGLLVNNSIGIEVDQQEVTISYSGSATSFQGQFTWPQALLLGRLDGAKIRRDRFIATAWGQPWLGGFPMFLGLVSSLDSVGRQSASIKVKSDLVLLDVQMPRDLFVPNCKNTWGDSQCGVDQEDWAVIATVGADPTRSILPWAGVAPAYALGKIHMSSAGDSTTRVRTISRVDGTSIYLSYPLDFDPLPGDTFTAYPSCKRLKDSCINFHGEPNWRARFKGFPFVPVAETAIG